MAAPDKVPMCGGYSDIESQPPAKPGRCRFKESLEGALRLGDYLPFGTTKHPNDFMFRLAVQKRVYGKHAEMTALLSECRDYLKNWQECVNGHEGMPGTFCYSSDFRSLMVAGFDSISKVMDELGRYSEEDLRDFGKACEFGRKWNRLQKALRDTFYAHLAFYPAWLGMEGDPQARRINCADCHLFDAIQPPSSTFIALSAFFIPREAKMPDGTAIPEGVSLHEGATEFHELHEHAHAYVHEKKAPGRRIQCEWIDEGIADWATVSILKPKTLERSNFLEMYDFWLVLNTLEDVDRGRLVKLWCESPGAVDWPRFVADALECIRAKKSSRVDHVWKADERCDRALAFDDYLTHPPYKV